MKRLLCLALDRHSGESRNPGQRKQLKPWMPDRVRHDGGHTSPEVNPGLFRVKLSCSMEKATKNEKGYPETPNSIFALTSQSENGPGLGRTGDLLADLADDFGQGFY